MAFVTQVTTAVCKKIQKMGRFSGKKNRSKLLEISQKVFVERDNKEDLLIKVNISGHCGSTVCSWHSQPWTRRPQVKEKAPTNRPMCLLQGMETGNVNAPSGNRWPLSHFPSCLWKNRRGLAPPNRPLGVDGNLLNWRPTCKLPGRHGSIILCYRSLWNPLIKELEVQEAIREIKKYSWITKEIVGFVLAC